MFSTTLTETSWANSRLVNADPAAIVNELRHQPGGDIIVLASFSLIKRLLHADALDELSLTFCPEIAGGGARLFDDGLPTSSWRLRTCTPTESGALTLVYDRKR